MGYTIFQVAEDFGYIYDSSIGIPPLKIPIWPYTLDHKIPHECKSGTCPTKSFPGKMEKIFMKFRILTCKPTGQGTIQSWFKVTSCLTNIVSWKFHVRACIEHFNFDSTETNSNFPLAKH